MLLVLTKTTDADVRHKYLELFHDCILQAIREICVNLLQGNIELSTAERDKLARYKIALRKLAASHITTRAKKRIINGQGRRILRELLPPTIRRLNDV